MVDEDEWYQQLPVYHLSAIIYLCTICLLSITYPLSITYHLFSGVNIEMCVYISPQTFIS